jgi:hypothetical protein
VGFGYFFVENNKIEIKNVAFIQKNRYYFFWNFELKNKFWRFCVLKIS